VPALPGDPYPEVGRSNICRRESNRWDAPGTPASLRHPSRRSQDERLEQTRIGFAACARQVRAAIDDVVLEKYTMPQSWAEASERHQRLYTDRRRRLQY
jgi:hypothetical protein